jgi:AraC-like DNA-binding protein
MPSQKIPLGWALNVTAGAVRNGLRLDELLADSYIKPKYGDSRDRISYAQYVLLCMQTGAKMEDALQGLGRKGMKIGFSALTVRIVDGCKTLEDAILALGRFFSLAGPSLQVGLRIHRGEASLLIQADSPEPASAYVLESNHAGWFSMCLSHFLGRRLPLTGITTRDANHISLNRRHWALGVPVNHGPVSALRFPASLLSARRVGAAGREGYWDCIRSALLSSSCEPFGVDRATSGPGLASMQLGELARTAGVSTSAMSRRLKRAGEGFRGARRQAIVEAAVGLLKTNDFSVDSIAMDLGYADSRSFRRFMKSATGKTPFELRNGDAGNNMLKSNDAVYLRIRDLAASLDAARDD